MRWKIRHETEELKIISQCRCVELDEDVLEAASKLQQCKRDGKKRGQVIVNFTPEGVINLDQIFWVSKHKEPVVAKRLD